MGRVFKDANCSNPALCFWVERHLEPEATGHHFADTIQPKVSPYRCGDQFSTVGIARAKIRIDGQIPMKMHWCWRGKAEVAMLDDDEWRRVTSLLNTGTEGDSKQRMFAAALREHERITGFHETNPNVLYDHRLSKYGPPCERCGQPLRTPRATLCGSCKQPRSV